MRSVSCSATPSRYGTVPSCATQSSATSRRLLSDPVDRDERFWPARIRWRLRGAWMWPTFITVTLVDGLILHLLPPVGTGVDLIPAILLATFGNLLLIGAIAPWLARRTWKRRPAADPGAPPRAQLEVLSDRIGTGLLLATIVGVVAAGLAARPTVVSETEDTEANAKAFRALVTRARRPGADPQPRDRQHGPPGRGLLPHLHRARRPRALLLRLRRHEPEAARQWTSTAAPSRTRRSSAARAARFARALRRPATSNRREPVRARAQRRLRARGRRRTRAACTLRSKLRPTARMRPLTASARSRVAAAGHAVQRARHARGEQAPAPRDMREQGASTASALSAPAAPGRSARTRRSSSSRCGPIR